MEKVQKCEVQEQSYVPSSESFKVYIVFKYYFQQLSPWTSTYYLRRGSTECLSPSHCNLTHNFAKCITTYCKINLDKKKMSVECLTTRVM
jgi:hypothetical protein